MFSAKLNADDIKSRAHCCHMVKSELVGPGLLIERRGLTYSQLGETLISLLIKQRKVTRK